GLRGPRGAPSGRGDPVPAGPSRGPLAHRRRPPDRAPRRVSRADASADPRRPLGGAPGGGPDPVRSPSPVIVDAHHHFWDPARADYPWMTEDLGPIRRAFGPADLAPSLAATGVEATVLVQTRSSLDETKEFLATAAATPFIRGVVGWVDLRDPGVDEVLARLRAAPGGDRLCGIRTKVDDEETPAWLLRDDVRRGIAAVGRAGLVYDLLVRTRELPAARVGGSAVAELPVGVDPL